MKSFGILHLIGLTIMIALFIVGRGQSHFAFSWEKGVWLDTRGASLLIPFAFIPYFCFIALRYVRASSEYTSLNVGIHIAMGATVGVVCGLLLSISALYGESIGATEMDPKFQVRSKLMAAAFFWVPLKYAFLGAITMGMFLVFATRRTRNAETLAELDKKFRMDED